MKLKDRVFRILFKNRYCRYGVKATHHIVNLEYFNSEINLGDTLSPVIFRWMLSNKNLCETARIKKTKHLMAVGSLIGGNGYFDATIWGTGIKSFASVIALSRRRYIQRLDIRAVRGPITRSILKDCGYSCPEIYGDPAVLMPLIYKPCNSEKKNDVAVILHFHSIANTSDDIKYIDIKTSDYKSFIDEILSSKKIVSSSLHGIILAEAYGVPTVFLGQERNEEILKYFDWYYSTGRNNIKIAGSIEEALEMEPMKLPDLTKMQANLIEVFPYDLWR